jgi:drug/metabolite transporter (DMT)-like permease
VIRAFRPAAGSTAQLLLFSGLYFALYALFGLGVKYAQSPAIDGFPGLTDLEFLVYSTLGSAALVLGVILIAGWWRFSWRAGEILYMFLSGTCTAFVLPTTTLMYSLPISVMVAMVLMRGSIIVVSRLVDTALLAQGLSKKKVRAEENFAVALSLAAVGLYLIFARDADFDFLRSRAALTILAVYLVSYALRLYCMNYFKFTRGREALATNKNYFAIEQLSAAVWIFGFVAFLLLFPRAAPGNPALLEFARVIGSPPEGWATAVLIGLPFGIAGFFSVFLFMFQGRTSTFAGLVNRLSSLLAGTLATLLFAVLFGGKWPKPVDWLSFALILLAVACLARAEIKDRRAGFVKKT